MNKNFTRVGEMTERELLVYHTVCEHSADIDALLASVDVGIPADLVEQVVQGMLATFQDAIKVELTRRSKSGSIEGEVCYSIL